MRRHRFLCLAGLASLAAAVSLSAQSVAIHGELKRWHKVTLDLDGPFASENGNPNPFTDYRMEVVFTHAASGLTYRVPGYFAADGQAAETSATSGRIWRAHLCPDATGPWRYLIHFRRGPMVAVDEDPSAGAPLEPYDGLTGTFTIEETDKTGRDHRAKGRLEYVGRHHLRFAGTGEYFLKIGADAPENFLAYEDFDNTPDHGGRRKSWAPHIPDWRPGDPTWKNGRGKGIIGAVNYMADKGCNVISFLTYNHHGDDKNVFPYVDPDDRLRLDCSKLDQWEIVFEHMDRRGIYLHFKTQEQENDQDMDGGELGPERRLYYRELIARFAHHLALNWNLGEENTNTHEQRVAFSRFFERHDPYHHLIVVHTFPGKKEEVYGPLLGDASALTGASLQCGRSAVFADTLEWVTRSAAAGKPWVVANDEQGPANEGILPDADDPDHDDVRRDVLWGNLMAGGAGIESYFGYKYANSDLTCEDYRSRDRWWDQCVSAWRCFMDNGVPFWAMSNQNDRLGGAEGWCLAGQGWFVVYLFAGDASAQVDLTDHPGPYAVLWWNPRDGTAAESGSVTELAGGGVRAFGAPPRDPGRDWAVILRPIEGVVVEAGDDVTVELEPGQTKAAVTLTGRIQTPGDRFETAFWVIDHPDGGRQTAAFDPAGTVIELPAAGDYTATLQARVQGRWYQDSLRIHLRPFSWQRTFSLAPVADTYLENGNRFNNAYLKVEPGRRVTYLRFDLSGLPAGRIQQATLTLTADGDPGNGALRLSRGSHASWTETDLSPANAPAPVPPSVTHSGRIDLGQTVAFDVTPLLENRTEAVFVLEMEAGGNDVWFSSREGAVPPVLAVTVQLEPPPAPRLRWTATGEEIRLEWDSRHHQLQAAETVTGPWEDVAGAIDGSWGLTPAGPQRFYRLRWRGTTE